MTDGAAIRVSAHRRAAAPTGRTVHRRQEAAAANGSSSSHWLPHFGQRPSQRLDTLPDKSFCSFNAACVQDATCYGTSDYAHIEEARDAVAHMLFVSGAYMYMCSGGLLADTDSSTQIPYFLTANHCISRSSEMFCSL